MSAATGMLDGTSWVSRRVTPMGVRYALTITFEGDRCAGSSGCNRFAGPAAATKDRLVVGPLAGTMMACDPELMDAEADALARLAATRRWSIVDGSLHLAGEDAAVLLVLAAAPTTLTGVRWMATAVNDGRGGVVSVIEGTELEALFGEDETVTGRAGCNRYRGPWSLMGAMLAIGPLATTRMACPDEAVMAQEAAFLRAIELAVSYRRELDVLELRDDDGALLVSFTAAAGLAHG